MEERNWRSEEGDDLEKRKKRKTFAKIGKEIKKTKKTLTWLLMFWDVGFGVV